MNEIELSVLLPAYNEADNLPEVVPAIAAALDATGRTWEIVVVDDGSTDGTRTVMAGLRSPQVRSIRLRRNSGKSAALSMGLDHVRGDLVVLMDADGQDDPTELGKLLAELDTGVDLVTGRRAVRHDRFVKRTTSRLYNGATAKVTGVPGKDFNSGFKVMRRDLADSLEMYGELHRYIPVLAVWNGFRVSEVDVAHHERLHGSSKFGRARFWRGFLDLVTVKFLTTYTARPFHLFGGLGFVIGAVGSVLLAWMLASKVMGNAIGSRPALQLGVLLVVVGVQMVSLGLLAELVVNLRRRRRLDATADGDLRQP
jgi:dolichol-phosphate mannosyltransferase